MGERARVWRGSTGPVSSLTAPTHAQVLSTNMKGLAASSSLVAAVFMISKVVQAFIPRLDFPQTSVLITGTTSTRTKESGGRDAVAHSPSDVVSSSSSIPLCAEIVLRRSFPNVEVAPGFLSAIRPNSKSTDTGRALIRAKAFANMAPRIIVSRGWNVLSEDFVYYSSATGPLDRAEYLGLVAIMERALPDLRQDSSRFEVGADGTVLYVSQAVGTFTGQLQIGHDIHEGSGLKYQGLKEVCVVAFNEDGQLQSLSAGLVVEEGSDEDEELVAAEALSGLLKRLESHKQKLEMTPTGKSAREKIQQDIDNTQAKIEAFEKDSETVKVAHEAGLGGLLGALGVCVPEAGDLSSALAGQGLDELFVMDDLDLMSVPTECETLLEDKGPMT